MTVPQTVRNYYNFKPNGAQKFGADRDGGSRKHRGTDFSHSTRSGTLVPALISAKIVGRVAAASWNGFGNQIVTEGKGPDGRTYRVSYAHGANPQRATGVVSQGQYISTEGTTGWTTGPCAHIEVYDVAKGKFIDPMILVKMVLNGVAKPTGTGNNKDSKVLAQQKKLNRLGYKLKEDGIRGPLTIAATKQFQRKYGLVSDGIWGPKTEALYKRLTASRPVLRRGSRGEFVKQLQKKLKLKQDGIFGPKTEAATKAYQKRHKLQPDGIVGRLTWRELGY